MEVFSKFSMIAAIGSLSSWLPGVIVTQEHKKKIINISSGILTIATNQWKRRRIYCYNNDPADRSDDLGR
jgi:hypothetical protein